MTITQFLFNFFDPENLVFLLTDLILERLNTIKCKNLRFITRIFQFNNFR